MHARLFSLLPVFALFMLGTSQVDQASLKRIRTEELHKTAEELKKIIVSKDVAALLAHVEKLCDEQGFENVKRDLENPDSFLYGYLFDTTVLGRHAARQPKMRTRRISVRDYFLRANKLQIDVGLSINPGGKVDWGYVTYYSSNFRKRDWARAAFEHSKGRWWIRDMYGFFSDWGD